MRSSGRFLLILLIGGCAAPTVRYADRSVTAEQVQESVRANYAALSTLLGSGNISVESPEMAQSGSFTLKLKKPDSLLVVLEGPFGIEVGAALVTRKEFLFYNSLSNKLFTGSTNAVNLSKMLRMNIEFDEMLSLFTGGLFFAEDQREPDDFQIEDEQFVLTFRNSTGSRRYWIEPEAMLIGRIQHLDQRGRLVIEQWFSDFQPSGETRVPRRMRVIQHRERRAVSVAYSDISVNTDPVDCTLRVPSNAERVQW
ncbi:MAG TPA: DUF4292 domain-containing protein [Bacteroidota bacterium]|nr:DUF4292 domain-containing protein [Bacteroidota bacterium]